MSGFTAALIQQSCTGSRKHNLEKSSDMIARAADAGASLVVLQELHSGLYFCQLEDPELCGLSEEISGETVTAIAAAAKKCGAVVISSIFERRAAGLYHNTAVVLERDGTVAGTYRKMHIPDDPGFYEKFYFAPGDLGFRPVRTSLGKLGVLVCWDQWYPEAARLMALSGADMLIYPTAIGWDPADVREEKDRQRDAWETVQRGHAIANGLPVLVANRVGNERMQGASAQGIDFWGSSFAAGQQGEILAKASSCDEEIVLVDIDLSRTETVRRIWPFLRDRRIDAYGDIVRRFVN